MVSPPMEKPETVALACGRRSRSFGLQLTSESQAAVLAIWACHDPPLDSPMAPSRRKTKHGHVPRRVQEDR